MRALLRLPMNQVGSLTAVEDWGRDGDGPRPSHQTGLADFPHPAFQSEIARMSSPAHVAGLSAVRWVIDFRLINLPSANQAFG